MTEIRNAMSFDDAWLACQALLEPHGMWELRTGRWSGAADCWAEGWHRDMDTGTLGIQARGETPTAALASLLSLLDPPAVVVTVVVRAPWSTSGGA